MDPYTTFDFLQLTVSGNLQSYAFYIHFIVKEPEVQDVAYFFIVAQTIYSVQIP